MALPVRMPHPSAPGSGRSRITGRRLHRTSPARAAFSLIELLTVLTLAGIIIGFALTRTASTMAQHQVARAATAIQNDIEAAFAIAGRNRRPVQMRWNAASRTFTVTDRTGATVYRTTELGTTYGLASGEVTVSNTPIDVFPNGLSSETLVVTIQTVRNSMTISRRVNVTRAGLVRID